ncbi:hypothetical protein ACIQ6Y_16190 [Streptomyces sp. NPDC096205]|uniref:hypothetical protein n=1 Tax=Streptomyces sp. NPDC096205 TaxID=3366081 RepID=UPI00380B45E9
MTDVVDADELLRRMQRSRACATQELRTWRARGEELRSHDPGAAREAEMRGLAYEVVLRVLDEILKPGSHAMDAPSVQSGAGGSP